MADIFIITINGVLHSEYLTTDDDIQNFVKGYAKTLENNYWRTNIRQIKPHFSDGKQCIAKYNIQMIPVQKGNEEYGNYAGNYVICAYKAEMYKFNSN